MDKKDLIVVLVTVATESEAEKITSVLLEEHQAACVNRIKGVFSKFWWQGKIDSADEVLLIIKTSSDVMHNIIETVKKNHSYSVPEIIAIPIISGNEDYLSWIRNEVQK
jgi:periplasmic divalent cation tolerance protein